MSKRVISNDLLRIRNHIKSGTTPVSENARSRIITVLLCQGGILDLHEQRSFIILSLKGGLYKEKMILSKSGVLIRTHKKQKEFIKTKQKMCSGRVIRTAMKLILPRQ